LNDASAPRTPRQVAEEVLLDPQRRAKLMRYAQTRFGIGVSDAEDILQETALRLLRQRGLVHKPDGFFFASFRASCARFLDARRSSFTRLRGTVGEDESIPDPCGSDEIDRQLALRQALGGISVTCRRLLSAYYAEGLSLSEAAAGFTLTYAVVSQRIHRCLKRLRACLN
jgi:RNA polymerase sigma factor (sigma-70 family)